MENDIQKSKLTKGYSTKGDSKFHEILDVIETSRRLGLNMEEKDYNEEFRIRLGKNMLNLIDEDISNPKKRDKDLLSHHKSLLLKIKDGFEKETDIITNVNNYVIVFLPLNAVNFFHILTDIMFYRSTMKWREIIQDKEILFQMYSVVYSKIIEMQLQLSKFFESIKIGLIGSNVAKYIVMAKSSIRKEDQSLSLIQWSYEGLGMQPEIQKVINSLSKLNEEIKDLGYIEVHGYSILDHNKERAGIDRRLKEIDAALSPTQHQQPQPQRLINEAVNQLEQPAENEISDSTSQTYYQLVEEELKNSGVEAYTDKWNQLRAIFSKLDDIIQDMAYEDGISKSEAIQLLIKDRKDLVKRAADEMAISESEILRRLTDHIDFFMKEPPRVRRVRRVITRTGEERIVEPGSGRLTGEEEKEKQRQQEVS